MQRRHDRIASKNRDQFAEQEKRSRINHSKRTVGLHPLCFTWSSQPSCQVLLQTPTAWALQKKAGAVAFIRLDVERRTEMQDQSQSLVFKVTTGRHEVQSWTRATKQSLCLMWQKVKIQLMLSMSFLVTVFWYCRRLYGFLAQLLKRWSDYLQRKLIKNHSVLAEVDLLGYSAREWKGETKQAKHMREAYNELFWNCHIKYLRQVKKDNYCVLRAVLFQILSQGIPFPSWMRERDILKLPEKLLYSQGCNWIQQYSFGPERYTGPNAFGKLRKCMETLKTNWIEISGTKDHEERGNLCNTLFSDESKEHRLYEAIKFIMLYEVVEAYEQIKNREEPIPHLFSRLLARDTSSDPLSFMMNHLNSIGDSGCLDQVEIFLLGYLLEVKIRVYRLHRFNTEEFQVNYPDEYRREWNEISLLTEDDRYYHIPVIRT